MAMMPPRVTVDVAAASISHSHQSAKRPVKICIKVFFCRACGFNNGVLESTSNSLIDGFDIRDIAVQTNIHSRLVK